MFHALENTENSGRKFVECWDRLKLTTTDNKKKIFRKWLGCMCHFNLQITTVFKWIFIHLKSINQKQKYVTCTLYQLKKIIEKKTLQDYSNF